MQGKTPKMLVWIVLLNDKIVFVCSIHWYYFCHVEQIKFLIFYIYEELCVVSVGTLDE